MEFKVFQKEIELQSRGWIPTFHDIRKEILEIVEASGVKNGTVCIASAPITPPFQMVDFLFAIFMILMPFFCAFCMNLQLFEKVFEVQEMTY